LVSIAVQADGKILTAGFFTSIGGQMRNRIARLDATTGLADSFNPTVSGPILAIAVQTDGKILVGGVDRNYIVRLETDGRLDKTLDPSTFGYLASATAVQAD